MFMEEEWLLRNEATGPGSAPRDCGNHWSERDGDAFMQKWLKRSESLRHSLCGVSLFTFLRAASVNKVS